MSNLNDNVNKTIKEEVYPMLVRMTTELDSMDTRNIDKLVALKQLVDVTITEVRLAMIQADPSVRVSFGATYEALCDVSKKLASKINVVEAAEVLV